ncbi:OmpP1/FadL family transporter [Eikenella corrodens]|uniref:OmpP1/FadL family transporter n=1 Tax=Eikenella corrodens TaxID=539 RepID=UPI00129ABB0A|nr:OmpP1/FadL family transporter [Eikenella corrodens]
MTTRHVSRLALLLATAFSAQAWASGYHFGTQSVSSQSTANSSSAEAADPSTLFHNPAGLTKLEGTQVSINVNLVAPSVKYSDAEAYYPGTNQPVQGATSGNIRPKSIVVAPHFYLSHRLNDNLALGLGMYVPFGSGTEYQHDAALRYNLNELSVKTIAIQPTVAYKINDQHSVALGLVAQHTTAKLRQYANFGAFPPLRRNGFADGYASVEGSDWGFGYNLAWLWDVNDSLRLGANYRSKVSHNLRGDAEWKLVGAAFQTPMGGTLSNAIRANGYAESEAANVRIVTPESFSLHGMYKLTPRWSLYGDATWTRHSRFNRAELNFGNTKTVANPQNPAAPARSNQTILTPQWRNTYKLSLGASYQITDPLQLRFGIAYDQSPVRGANTRMSTLPDADRLWLSLGGKYDINQQHSLNLAYSYVHVKNTSANVNGWCGGTASGSGSQACVSSRTHGSAKFRSHSHILGLQYTYRF